MINTRVWPLALILAASSLASNASTVTWVSTQSKKWSEKNNWSGAKLPGPGDIAVIGAGVNQVNIELSDNFTIDAFQSYRLLSLAGKLSLTNGTSTATDFNQVGGSTLSGAGGLQISGKAAFNANFVYGAPLQTGSGSTIFSKDSTVKINKLNLDGGRQLVNHGALTMGSVSPVIDLNSRTDPGGGRIENSGRFVIESSSISNSTIKASQKVEESSFVNLSGGVVEHLNIGKFTITAPTSNNGTFHFGAQSKFAMEGSFKAGADSQLIFDVNGLTSDLIASRTFSDVTFGGTLQLVATDAYKPKIGDSFALFTSPNAKGSFLSVTGGAGFAGLTLKTAWAGDRFVVSAVPEPETYAMLLSGLGLVGMMARRRRTISKDTSLAYPANSAALPPAAVVLTVIVCSAQKRYR